MPGPAPIIWTAPRKAVLRAAWPAGETADAILAQVNALPGPLVTKHQLFNKAGGMKLRRPIGKPIVTHDRPKIVARTPAEEAAAIEQFIRERGVTRCPAAICSATTARLSPEDRAAIAAHQDAQQAAYLASWPMQRRRVA